MKRQGETIMLRQDMPYTASTDMGNVSHQVPTFHGGFGIETEPTAAMHSPEFATAAEKKEAHESAIRCAKGMAGMALRVLMEDEVAEEAKRDFKDSGDSS
ncbi:hypothetical protein CDD81_6432 [Ophiocordyceps australis]|uniref:Peptidase M20 dimerisation domain-containing protein n=1 Tax=Ophiocordyceps australis TaxID=1399860 RepID=A0A2C5YAR4_9HYPO|nr:hypothetical protein CDD81_6432 [Ophiocordyceps australis]